MNLSQEGAESYLKVGQSVIFYPEMHRQDGARHQVVVRGWQKGSYILLEMTPLPTRSIMFRENADCSMRFLKDGVACSMDATIIDWQVSRKKPTFTVSWPKSLRTAAVRRSERVDVNIPCTLFLQDVQLEGAVLDLSVGGCGVRCPREVARDSQLIVSMTLPDGVYIDHAPLVVRSVRDAEDGQHYLGCMLNEAEPSTRASIEFYVTTTLLRARGISDGTPTVLILDPDSKVTEGLPEALKEEGFEVHVRSNLIDGISSARLRLPAALLVAYDWSSATALDFCRVLHTSPALSSMPVMVYNAPENTHAALTEAGAESCHTQQPDTEAIIAQVRGKGETAAQSTASPDTAGTP